MKKVWKVVVPVNSVKVIRGFAASGEPITEAMDNRSPRIPQASALIASHSRTATTYRYMTAGVTEFEDDSATSSESLVESLSDNHVEEIDLPCKRQVRLPGARASKKSQPAVQPPAPPSSNEEDCLFLYEVKPPSQECVIFYDRWAKSRTVFGLESMMNKATSLEILEKFVSFAKHVQTKVPLSDEDILQLLVLHKGCPDEVLRSLNC